MAPWTNPQNYSVGQSTSVANFDNTILSNIDFAGSHAHTGAAGDGAYTLSTGSTISGDNYAQVTYNYITLLPIFAASSSMIDGLIGGGNPSTIVSQGTMMLHSPSRTGESAPASATYLVDLSVGTWNLTFIYDKEATNAGILGACISSVSIGQIDTGGTLNPNTLSPASPFTISTSGIYQLHIGVTAGSVGGSPYVNGISLIELRRMSA